MSVRIAMIAPMMAPMMALAVGCDKKAEAPATAADTAVAAPAAVVSDKPAESAPAVSDKPAAPAPAGAEKPAEPTPAPAEPVAAAPTAVWKTEGFATPESVLVHGDTLFVSNIQGAPLDKDDNGFISKLDADGKITELRWISGESPDHELNAPKGMGIHGGVLYVADIDHVRAFSLETGAKVADYFIEGATFLNDIHVFRDDIFVSDTGVGADFKPAGTPAIWTMNPAAKGGTWLKVEIPAVGLPNGVFCLDNSVLYFNGFDDTKAIHVFDRAYHTMMSKIDVPAGGLDGLFVHKGADGTLDFFVSSWETGTVYRGNANVGFKAIATGLKGPADFAVDLARKRVIVPVFMDNRVDAYAFE